MGTFLFAAQPGMGHLNPLLTIARRLRHEGHEAVFVQFGPRHVARAIADHGFRALPLRPPLCSLGLVLLPYTSGFVETTLAMQLFTCGILHYARQLQPHLEELKPDAAVVDFSFPGAFLAAEARGIPWVSIYHAGLMYRGPGIPPFGSGLPIGGSWGWRGRLYSWLNARGERKIRASVARARARLGLPPADSGPYFWTSPWATLVLSAEEAEAPRDPLPPRTFYIGPCFAERRGGQEGFPFERLSPELPKIYVSLGTVFNNKPQVFARIIRAFADGRHQLIISAGGAYERLRSMPLPDHVLLFPRVPQVEILPRVDAVISHGGNNTVNETLAAGRPLLVLPVGGEQGDNASRVVYLGAGLRADIARTPAAEVRRLVDLLLQGPFRQRAQEVAAALARTEGAATAARFIEHVARTRSPVERPPGYPLTVTRDLPLPWQV
jgi:UDP:flavonoid glycosyltransferase YjiC (YdhE family)